MEILQNTLVSALAFVVVLSLVVFVHEYGHFKAARLLKVAVDTFSIGFGKSLAEWRDRAGIRWKVGTLPLGGYVKFADDADGVSAGPRERITDPAVLAEARAKGFFHAQPIWVRSIVVAAGPLTNFVFAIAAFAALIMILGRDVTDMNSLPPRIDGVSEGSAAQEAGLRGGDVVLAIDDENIESFAEFQSIVSRSADRPLRILVQREGGAVTINATPRGADGVGADGAIERVGFLGVERRTLDSERRVERVGPVEAVSLGAQQTWSIVAMTGMYMGDVITGRQSGEHIAGPVGIFQESGRRAQAAMAAGDDDDSGPLGMLGDLALSLLHWAALLSVAVGIVNLLPIPILDGGHLLFYAIEAVRGGKPLPPIAQEWAYRAGFAVMASLFLFATWNDVTRTLGSLG